MRHLPKNTGFNFKLRLNASALNCIFIAAVKPFDCGFWFLNPQLQNRIAILYIILCISLPYPLQPPNLLHTYTIHCLLFTVKSFTFLHR